MSQDNGQFSANADFDTGLRLGIASALGQTGFNSADDENPRRNLFENFGWPKSDLDGWDDENWVALYLRNGYAQTVNDKLADVSWRDAPIVSDAPESEEQTEFESAIQKANKNLNLWAYAHRTDRVAGIGQHGLLVLGLSDVAGENNQDKWETSAFEQEYTNGLDDIDMLKPVLEMQIEDIDWGGPEDGERWGKPVTYTIDFSDDIDDETEDETGYRTVHWSRVIDVPAQVPLDDETLSRPRAEAVLNNILDIEKALGATAEAAFMSANSDIWMNSDPDKVDMSQGADEIRDELMRYFEGQPFLRTQGMDIEQLSGEVQDPSGIVENNLDVIASATGIPKSALRGNQSGDVSGSEKDERDLFGTAEERREQYNTPYIVRQIIDRFQRLGLFPQVESYNVEWPGLMQLSELDQSKIEVNRSQVIRQAGAVISGLGKDYLKTGDIPEDVDPEELPDETPDIQAQFNESFDLTDNQEVNLTPPESAQNNAQKVLDWQADPDKDVSGMTDTGWNRARQLASGDELSPSDIKEIYAWFARHGPEEAEVPDGTDPWKDNGRVAILGWGGESMRDWVEGKRSRLTELGELDAVANAVMEMFTTNAEYSEGDVVDTPDGVGVVVDILTETVEGDDRTVEATSDSPTYVVAVEDESVGMEFYKASDLSRGEIETDVDPTEDIEEQSANVFEAVANALGITSNNFRPPKSWRESNTPSRLIALKALAGMGGSFDGCVREMEGSVASPNRFCGSFLDYALGNPYWRGDSPLPGA